MTTAIYDHENKIICCDSRITSGSYVESDRVKKYIEKDGEFIFWCGDMAMALEAARLNVGGEFDKSHDFDFIVARGSKVYSRYLSNGFISEIEVSWSLAIGSGSPFAQSALDFGKSAKQAIRYASKKDSATGGKIRQFDVTKMQFI